MTALICGSFAFDTIMVFHDKFKHHILPEQVHILNVSFMVPELRREFGGCAGNIAYNLHLLGGSALPMGTVGTDFAVYAEWMDRCGIARTHVTSVENTYTAQAFITTDMDDNQITAFHPGAMNFAHYNQVTQAQAVSLAIISPDGRQGMIEHAEQCVTAGIPFIFDPGQGMPLFNGEELLHFLNLATWVIVNDYEWQLLQERTRWSLPQVVELVQALIVTKGNQGAMIYTPSATYSIPCARAHAVKDPTGCGDAFRGGLLYGLLKGLDWQTTGRIASLMGAIKVEHYGTQNHTFTLTEFKQRFQENFGDSLPI
jgi:adenosine kinase